MRRAPPPRRRAQSASDWLENAPEFAGLAAQAQRLQAIGASLRTLAPTLALTVVTYDRDMLVIGAPNAAVAAKLRQVEPTLVHGLRQQGWPLRQLRIKPQFQVPAPVRMRPARTGPNAAAVADLTQLAQSVHDPALQTALARLAHRHRPAAPQPSDVG